MRYSSAFNGAILTCCFMVAIGCSQSASDLSRLDHKYVGPNGEHFDAMIDEKEWWPWSPLLPPPPVYHLQSEGRDGILYFHYFQVRRDHDPWSQIDISIDTLHSIGTYSLADSGRGAFATFFRVESREDKTDTTIYYSTDSLHTGVLTVT